MSDAALLLLAYAVLIGTNPVGITTMVADFVLGIFKGPLWAPVAVVPVATASNVFYMTSIPDGLALGEVTLEAVGVQAVLFVVLAGGPYLIGHGLARALSFS